MRYGFIVREDEAQSEEWMTILLNSEEAEPRRTIFVEVEESVPAYPGLCYCSFYYAPGFATLVIVPEQVLQARFPKSFGKKDSGDEYTKMKNTMLAMLLG